MCGKGCVWESEKREAHASSMTAQAPSCKRLQYTQVSTDAMAQLTDAADYDVRRKVAEMATEVIILLPYLRDIIQLLF